MYCLERQGESHGASKATEANSQLSLERHLLAPELIGNEKDSQNADAPADEDEHEHLEEVPDPNLAVVEVESEVGYAYEEEDEVLAEVGNGLVDALDEASALVGQVGHTVTSHEDAREHDRHDA